MDKKQKKGGTTMNSRTVQGTTLREENTGKKRVVASSMHRMQHLQSLATWASVETGIPPLGALFGHRLAASAEAEGVPLDPSTFACCRCESVLQPGFNCTVRIEKNMKKAKRCKKSRIPSQNNVVYKCHFCSHHNLIKGTHRGYVKNILPSRTKPNTGSKVQCSRREKLHQKYEIPLDSESISELKCVVPESDAITAEIPLEKSPLTPLASLENSSKKKRKRNGTALNKASSSENSSVILNSVEVTGGSSKRKRKGWSSLKEIAESNKAQRNFAIPFLLPVAK